MKYEIDSYVGVASSHIYQKYNFKGGIKTIKNKLTKREKIMLGACAGVTITSGIIVAYALNKGRINNAAKVSYDNVKFLVLESDCISKALQNANNKITRKENAIADRKNELAKSLGDLTLKRSIEKHEKDLEILLSQVKQIKEISKALKADEVLYNK